MKSLQQRMYEVFPAPHKRGLRAEISRVCGVKGSSVTAWFDMPDKVSAISREHAEALIAHFHLKVSPKWLSSGAADDAPTFVGDSQTHDDQHKVLSLPATIADKSDVVIPQFETGGAMGHGLVLREQPGIIKQWTVSESWLQQNVHRVTSPRNLAIVTGFGPSMRPVFNPGDPLLVDTGVKRVDSEGVYFFRVGDEGFVKQIQRIPTEDGLILRAKSYNTLYDPFDITKGMDFEVFGRVVKVWKGEEF